MKDLKLFLCELESGRFKDIIHTLSVRDICSECDYFNPTIKDISKGYRCHCIPRCIAATLHPELQEYLWVKLGWIK